MDITNETILATKKRYPLKSHTPWNKGKIWGTMEDRFGVEKANLIKTKISNSSTGKILGSLEQRFGEEKASSIREKLRLSHLGQIAWNKGLTKETSPIIKAYAEKQSGKVISQELRKRISERMSGEKHPNWGKHLSEETRKRIGDAQRGRTYEDVWGAEKAKQQKEKLSRSKKGIPIPESKRNVYIKNVLKVGINTRFKKGNIPPNKGIPISPESKAKMMESMRKTFSNPILINHLKEKRALQVTPVKDTSIEVKIQNFLKEMGIGFFTHQYLKEIEHGYQCDIFIPSMNLVIECDGDYWHHYPTGTEIDHIRTNELIEKGFKVLRLWECEIINMDLVAFRQRLYNS